MRCHFDCWLLQQLPLAHKVDEAAVIGCVVLAEAFVVGCLPTMDA
jgi:hypothetical protein